MKHVKITTLLILTSSTLHTNALPYIPTLLGFLAASSATPLHNNFNNTLPNTTLSADTPTLFFPSQNSLANCMRREKDLASFWYDKEITDQAATIVALKQMPRDLREIITDTSNLVITKLLKPVLTNNGVPVPSQTLHEIYYQEMPKRTIALLTAAIECRITRQGYRKELKLLGARKKQATHG